MTVKIKKNSALDHGVLISDLSRGQAYVIDSLGWLGTPQSTSYAGVYLVTNQGVFNIEKPGSWFNFPDAYQVRVINPRKVKSIEVEVE